VKKAILLAVLIGSPLFNALSQAPVGYYDAAAGKFGEELKSALHSILKGHTEFPYSSSSTDVWDMCKDTDRDPDNASNVILFYTGWSVNADQEFNNGNGWNREHVWAKSRGDFGTSPGPGTDAHHIRPSDISVNGARENRWFDTCSIPYVDGAVPTGCFKDNVRWVWQPRDEVKGDVARMIFYMACRYEGGSSEPDLEIIDFLPADNFTREPVHAKLSALMAWHKEDTVNAFERNRNEVIYGYQKNRNPFIDHPEYAEKIWGSDTIEVPTQISQINPKWFDENSMQIHPNPVSIRTTISFSNPDHSAYQLIIYDISGRVRRRVQNLYGESIILQRDDLPSGIYLIELRGTANYKGKILVK